MSPRSAPPSRTQKTRTDPDLVFPAPSFSKTTSTGAVSGAAPPLLGGIAVTNQIEALPVLLVMIVFVWTPPHFWPLAIHRVEDFRRADL
nr:UbiA family prenyltransferase [Thioclava atlantica]